MGACFGKCFGGGGEARTLFLPAAPVRSRLACRPAPLPPPTLSCVTRSNAKCATAETDGTSRGQEGHRLRDPAGGNYNSAVPNDPDPETKRRQALAGALSVPPLRVGSAQNLKLQSSTIAPCWCNWTSSAA